MKSMNYKVNHIGDSLPNREKIAPPKQTHFLISPSLDLRSQGKRLYRGSNKGVMFNTYKSDDIPQINKPVKLRHESSVEITRKVKTMLIKDDKYEDVIVTLNCYIPNYLKNIRYKVNVIVEKSNKTIYQKTFKDSYLRASRSGRIEVERPNYYKLILNKTTISGWSEFGIIKEKERMPLEFTLLKKY